MIKEEKLPVRRKSHKLLLVILKVIPVITAFCCLLNTLCSYFGIDASLLSMFSGMSLLSWLFVLIATYVFRFCIYHRMFLYYILVSNILSIYDFYVGLPVSVIGSIMIQLVISGIFLFLILYFYVKCNKKTSAETY